MGLRKRIEAILDPSGGAAPEVGDDVEVAISARDLRRLRDVYERVTEEKSGVFAAHGSRAARKLLNRLWACAHHEMRLVPSVEDTRILAAMLPEYAPHAIIVPSEITPAMIKAWQWGFSEQMRRRTGSGRVSSFYKRLRNEPAEVVAYRAMLAVAPKPEAPPVEPPDPETPLEPADVTLEVLESPVTYTVAQMQVSRAAYLEIRGLLEKAGYDHAISDDHLDMTHIGLIPDPVLVVLNGEPFPTSQASISYEEIVKRAGLTGTPSVTARGDGFKGIVSPGMKVPLGARTILTAIHTGNA